MTTRKILTRTELEQWRFHWKDKGDQKNMRWLGLIGTGAWSSVGGKSSCSNLLSRNQMYSLSSWCWIFFMISIMFATATKFPSWKEPWNLCAYEKSYAQGSGLCCTSSVQKKDNLVCGTLEVVCHNLIHFFLTVNCSHCCGCSFPIQALIKEWELIPEYWVNIGR